ncbi:MAG: NAD(P)/FAD-dependent oxidoreductase [Acidobacteria bacterium]|nr:NAD(P)/FAD-dependent oxidoreductase [Acidobacteriota bacterium]
MPDNARRIAIIGGGLTGLVAADRLAAAGQKAIVYERYPEAGGLVGTFKVGGEPLECFYHHLFTSDRDYVSLARDLGLGDALEWLPSKMGFYSHGRLWDFGTPFSLLKFHPLGVRGRLEFVLSTLALRHNPRWQPLEAETAVDWFRKNGYGRALAEVWGPLLRQKYGRHWEEIGLVWLWGKIALRTRSRDETGLGERLGYMKGSFGRAVDALLKRLKERGGEFRPTRPVKLVRRAAGGYEVTAKGGSETFDLVLSTVAIPEFLNLVPDLPDALRDRWKKVRYTHALCPVLILDRSLSKYYWTNVGDTQMPFGGVIEHTNYIPRERYGGHHVLYISNYVLPDDPKWTMRDSDLWQIYLPALEKMMPALASAKVLEKHLFRAEYAQPIIPARYSETLPEVRTELSGLYSASMAQIYPEDRGQNYAVKMGRQAAETILSDLSDGRIGAPS